MNENKVACIICVNDDQCFEMCKWYLEQLVMPDEILFEIIPMRGEKSISIAYNKAIHQSDAKYKIYMHQDVFILNRTLISDVIEVFKKDEKIGLIGLIGGTKLPSDACCWDHWNAGITYAGHPYAVVPFRGSIVPEEGNVIDVDAIDGMIMFSQYDLPWREDICTGWDFYDVSQSLEFKRMGYRVVIPYQEEPWILHDCGFSKLGNYEKTRERIIEEYSEVFDNEYVERKYQEIDLMGKRVFAIEYELICNQDFSTLNSIDQSIHDEKGNLVFRNNDVALIHIFLSIMELEKNDTNNHFSFLGNSDSIAEMKKKFISIKYLLRKIDYRDDYEALEIINKLILKHQISVSSIKQICSFTCIRVNEIIDLFG